MDEFSKMSSEEALQEDNGALQEDSEALQENYEGSLFCFTEDKGTCTEFRHWAEITTVQYQFPQLAAKDIDSIVIIANNHHYVLTSFQPLSCSL